ncbi:hypothetical protein QTP70_001478 [Hemibagrus guttatus]|uniref:RNA-directed DNA polymerase n=1 Tax=Hemibagrus guttatus TaxID=175788 RepID=A0AAE0UUU1_9TELE|nr:hypothetical protein QTP70_001478 [Hemibagrus guttatus]
MAALIDSGAAINLMDKSLVEELQLPTVPCTPPLWVMAVDNKPIGEGHLYLKTKLLTLTTELFHSERITLFVICSPAHPVILDLPWLQLHDPPCLTTNVESPGTDTIITLPLDYNDLGEVFSKENGTHLLPHQPWDCAIDLLPNAMPPKSRIYPLSLPETKAMEDYIKEALAADHIRPSTSPPAAGFFFVEKKDGGLRISVGLTRSYPYPLPLVPATLEQLQRACVFSKPQLYTTAPILCQLDSDTLFVVEVDASSIGAVLSHRQENMGKLHPCAFYSRKLTPAEANYDVGNREHLFIKTALEEWRHWLGGACHPFLVIADHHNLEYLRVAKCLNPRQARWALLFTRFKFSVTYRPESKNGKADALSRITRPTNMNPSSRLL